MASAPTATLLFWCGTRAGLNTTPAQGGTGSGGPKVETAHYTTSAYLVGGRGPITRLQRVWANDVLLYDWNNPASTAMQLTLDHTTGVWSGTVNGWTLRLPRRAGAARGPHHHPVQGHGKLDFLPRIVGHCCRQPPGRSVQQFLSQLDHQYYNAITGLDAVMTQLCCMCGHSAGDLDFYDLAGISVAPTAAEGYLIGSQKSAADAMSELQAQYNFALVEEDGVLRSKLRGGSPVTTLVPLDLRQHADNEATPGEASAASDINDLPYLEQITFLDPGRHYNPGLRTFERGDVPVPAAVAGIPSRGRRLDSLSYTAAITGGRAQRIAKIRLGEKWVSRNVHPIAWGMKHLWLGCADEVAIATDNGVEQVRIDKVTQPLYGAATCAAPESDPLLYQISTPTDTSGLQQPTMDVVGDLTYIGWDGNAVRDADNAYMGIYLAVSKPANEPWYQVNCGSYQYGLVWCALNALTTMPRATMGTTVGILANAPSGVYDWDRTNVLTVDLLAGNLSSTTEAQLLDGVTNGCRVGAEYVQFATATPVPNPGDPSGLWGNRIRYNLTDLIRGCRGSESAIAGHGASEPFVLLDSSVRRVYAINTFAGQDVNLYVQEYGAGGTVTNNVSTTCFGYSLMPYAPIHLKAVKDAGSGDIIFTWTRRSRYADTYYVTGQDAPLGEATEAYELDILNGATLLRMYKPGTSTARYLAADQVSDWGHQLAAGAAVDVQLFQLSAIIGHGYPAAATLTIQAN